MAQIGKCLTSDCKFNKDTECTSEFVDVDDCYECRTYEERELEEEIEGLDDGTEDNEAEDSGDTQS